MKKKLFPLALLLFLIVLASSFSIVSAQEVPSYQDKYVNDFAKVLDASQSAELRNLFSSVDQETTAEVVFVSIDAINGEDISQYSLKIGEEWMVGKADKDNGLVILYVKDIGKIWVSTGYGLEGILPDSKVGRLLDESYVPLRDAGNVSSGIIAFSNAVTQVIYDNKEEVLSGQTSGDTGSKVNYSFWIYAIWFIVFVVGEIVYLILAPTKSWWLGGVLGGGVGVFFGFFILSSVLWTIILLVLGGGVGSIFDYFVSKGYVTGKHRRGFGFWGAGSGSSGGGGGFGGGGFGGGGAGR